MSTYIYPKLSNRDYGFVRVGGNGLANCMFIAAWAAIEKDRIGEDAILLRPTWERLGLGQFLRREKDKRFYAGLFRCESFWKTLKKLWIIKAAKNIKVCEWERKYFEPIWPKADVARQYFQREILPEAIARVPLRMKTSIAVHVRLGDFPQEYRTPIDWYRKRIEEAIAASEGGRLDFQLFSDGTDEELEPLIKLPGVHRAFYGNALADIIAISRCGFLIGSDSTFSCWGAFLGNVPAVFNHLIDCPPHQDTEMYAVIDEDGSLPKKFVELIKHLGD